MSFLILLPHSLSKNHPHYSYTSPTQLVSDSLYLCKIVVTATATMYIATRSKTLHSHTLIAEKLKIMLNLNIQIHTISYFITRIQFNCHLFMRSRSCLLLLLLLPPPPSPVVFVVDAEYSVYLLLSTVLNSTVEWTSKILKLLLSVILHNIKAPQFNVLMC